METVPSWPRFSRQLQVGIFTMDSNQFSSQSIALFAGVPVLHVISTEKGDWGIAGRSCKTCRTMKYTPPFAELQYSLLSGPRRG